MEYNTISVLNMKYQDKPCNMYFFPSNLESKTVIFRDTGGSQDGDGYQRKMITLMVHQRLRFLPFTPHGSWILDMVLDNHHSLITF